MLIWLANVNGVIPVTLISKFNIYVGKYRYVAFEVLGVGSLAVCRFKFAESLRKV